MIIISKVRMLITAFFRILSQLDKGYFIPSVYSLYNLIYETQGKVQKIRPYIDSCAVVGGLQSKRTQVKMYLSGDKIYSSEVKTYPSGVKVYPVCSQNVPMIFVLLQFVYKLIEIMYSSSLRFLTWLYFEFALHD